MTDDGRRVAAVTGGTGAIGEAIARGIAQDLKYEVILVCRNASKAERACSNISAVTGNPRAWASSTASAWRDGGRRV